MSGNSVTIDLSAGGSVGLWARRHAESACLVLETGGARCEVDLGRAQVEALRDQLPEVLAGLDRWVAENDGCERGEDAGRRAARVADRALELAAVVPDEVAASLREAAAEASARAEAADAAVRALENAALAVDEAVERLDRVLGEAEAVLPRRP
ncbi:hypothetical protein [Actinosynnema pretiosum]|uniref:Uncharacterized protein n=1 Tax=Actinosynnema pretiosum TaxID=42197 RepID=A0A290Z3D0_9PSEU|nr:hypothetical protein [Actinosynnema pretiosum]ATE53536.1 hypothetical protein CNX65_09720 [Actinosynnema pretiosum]